MSKKDKGVWETVKSPFAGEGMMSGPAVVTLIGYIILAIVLLIPFDMYVYDHANDVYVKKKYNASHRVLLVLLLFFPFFLSVYSVNCMVVGDCVLWSWVVSIIILLWAIFVIIAAINYDAFRLSDITG
jgi:hypothetical protein